MGVCVLCVWVGVHVWCVFVCAHAGGSSKNNCYHCVAT